MTEKRRVKYSGRQLCPLCRAQIGRSSPDLGVCPSCSTVYHKACYAELGGCASPGCRRLRRPRREARTPKLPLPTVETEAKPKGFKPGSLEGIALIAGLLVLAAVLGWVALSN